MVEFYEDAKAKWSEAFAATVANVAAEKESGTKVDGGGDVMYSEGDVPIEYTYDYLVNKPDMPLTIIDNSVTYKTNSETRNQIIAAAIDNAINVGHKNNNGNAVVFVEDLGADVIVGKNSIRHGLDRRLEVNAPVYLKLGEILKNAIKINELTPRTATIANSYILIGAAKNNIGEPYIVEFVVNRHTNEISTIDVLYSANTKTESAGITSPEITGVPATLTDSTISIAQLLKYVNRYFPDVLPVDVASHFGRDTRAEGYLGTSAMYSEEASPREALSDALADVTMTEEEARLLERYRKQAKVLDGLEKELRDVGAELKRLSWDKGKREGGSCRSQDAEIGVWRGSVGNGQGGNGRGNVLWGGGLR